MWKYLSFLLNQSTPTYAGKQGCTIVYSNPCLSDGHSRSMLIGMNNHIGTHIDFPAHFCKNGSALNSFEAKFWVFSRIGYLECPVKHIEDNLYLLQYDIEILIINSGFGLYRGTDKYIFDQPVVDSGLANKLRKKFKNIRVFGFDMISISSILDREEGRRAHRSFLCENEILLLEDMNLKNINCAPTEMVVAPLMLDKADGSPCTVFGYFEQYIK